MHGDSHSTRWFRLELLGHLRVTENATVRRSIRIRSRRGQALLALLALDPDRAIPRAKAATLLWEDQSEARARHNLRQLLTELRDEFGPTFEIGIEKNSLTLNSATFRSDVSEFLDHAKKSDAISAKEAVELYAGELFDPGPVSPSFDDWISVERRKLHALALTLFESHVENLIAADRPQEALGMCERLSALDPLREATHRTFISLEATVNGTSSAMKRAKNFASLLRKELGVAPEPQTTELIKSLTAQHAGNDFLEDVRGMTPLRRRLVLAAAAVFSLAVFALAAVFAVGLLNLPKEKAGRYDAALYHGFAEITKYHTLPAVNDQQAYSHFRKALKMKPDSVAAKVGLARIMLQRIYEARSENIEQDVAHIDEMLAEAAMEAPSYVPGLTALGSLRKYQGRSEEAMALFEEAIRFDPMAAGAHANLGHMLVFLGRPEETESHVRRAIEYSPSDPHLASWLVFAGEADMHLERYESAIRWLEKSLEVNPKITAGLTLLAAAQVLTGEDSKAAATASKLKQMSYDFQKFKSRVQHAVDRRVRLKTNPEVAQRRVRIETALQRAFELTEIAER